MANRVVLGAFDSTFVLRASLPGQNVLSTALTAKQLAFSSEWAEAANCFLTGSITFSSAAYIDVMYGETFGAGSFPSCIFVPRLSSTQMSWLSWEVSFTDNNGNGYTTPGVVRILPDRARIMKDDSGDVVGGYYMLIRGNN